jgi:hypothetical protein
MATLSQGQAKTVTIEQGHSECSRFPRQRARRLRSKQQTSASDAASATSGTATASTADLAREQRPASTPLCEYS